MNGWSIQASFIYLLRMIQNTTDINRSLIVEPSFGCEKRSEYIEGTETSEII